MRQRTSKLLISMLLMGSALGFAQEKPQPPVFGSAVTVVTLPVFVTDGQGKAIGGLTVEDFQVQDEGRAVKIVGFQEIDAAAPPPAASRSQLAPAAHRQFLLLFDLSFSTPAGLLRARQGASDFVRRSLLTDDLAGVATFSVSDGMKLLVGFTTDREQVVRAIETLGVLKLERKPDPLSLVYSLGPPGSSGSKNENKDDILREEMRTMQVIYKNAEDTVYKRRVGTLLDGLRQLAQSLDSVQGRKQVLYFSAGFREDVLVGEQGAASAASSEAVIAGRLWEVQSDSYFGDSQSRKALDDTAKSFSFADTVVHTLDVSGLSVGVDASQSEAETGSASSGRESLSEIASLSGGRFVKDTNNLSGALDEILEASRRYYILAFEPEGVAKPGKFHKLKVTMRGKGRKASARAGYFERAPFAQETLLGRRLEAGEAIAKSVAKSQIRVEALAVPYRGESGQVSVPIVLDVDGASLLERGAGDELGLEIYGYAFDEKGNVEDAVNLAATLSLPKLSARIRESGVQYHAAFTLPAGKHSLRFLVRDGQTGRSGTRSIDVTVPAFDGLLLYAPLFMEDPAGRLILRGAVREGEAAGEDPFHVAAEAFAPRLRPRLVNGTTGSVCVLAYTGTAKYEAGASFEIKAQLLDRDGNAVRMGRMQLGKAVAESDGFRRFVLNVTPADVPPGDYSFKVKLKDPATGVVSEATQAILVE